MPGLSFVVAWRIALVVVAAVVVAGVATSSGQGVDRPSDGQGCRVGDELAISIWTKSPEAEMTRRNGTVDDGVGPGRDLVTLRMRSLRPLALQCQMGSPNEGLGSCLGLGLSVG